MRLADDLDVIEVLDRPSHPGDDERVVIGDQHPDARELDRALGDNGKLWV
jgi:hypothetical protein